MVRSHPPWYESTLTVVEHCETTTNQSQDSCLEHFRSISLLDFEFRKIFSCQAPVFFSEGVRIFCRRDYFGNRQIQCHLFFVLATTHFCVLKPTFLHQTARFIKIKSTVAKMSGMEAMFYFLVKTKSLTVDLP